MSWKKYIDNELQNVKTDIYDTIRQIASAVEKVEKMELDYSDYPIREEKLQKFDNVKYFLQSALDECI